MNYQIKLLKQEIETLTRQIEIFEKIHIPNNLPQNMLNFSSAINQCIVMKKTFANIVKELESMNMDSGDE